MSKHRGQSIVKQGDFKYVSPSFQNLRETMVVSENIRKTMMHNRSSETSTEVTLRTVLWQSGIRGYRKNVRKLPGKPDIVFGRKKIAIFVNGCYWHRCPKCTRNRTPKTNEIYWNAKFEANVERDQRNQAELEKAGWHVEVIWECEIKADLGAAVERIRLLLNMSP